MKRLIIVGNGFDLAHGLKTSYDDFIRWYLSSIFEKSEYEDAGLSAFANTTSSLDIARFIKMYATRQISPQVINRYLNNPFSPSGIGSDDNLEFYFNFKFDFLKDVFTQHCQQTWVDIEELYYKKLLKISRIENEISRNGAIISLNNCLTFIKNKLEEYLETIECPLINEDILSIILEHDKYLDTFSQHPKTKFKHTLALNFNYTSTIHKYCDRLKDLSAEVTDFSIRTINIHGEINNIENTLIFGFVDEMDDNYKKLEVLNNNDFLDNMKSFGYFNNSNYHELIKFIDSEEYEVFIFGHSCGLSDRVMLNMIFENHNCKVIKLFYHQTQDGNNFKK